MDSRVHNASHAFTSVCFVFEWISVGLVLGSYDCFCIEGFEIVDYLLIYQSMIFFSFINDTVFFLFMFPCFHLSTFGTDPAAIVYHFLCFLLNMASGIAITLTYFVECTNPALKLITLSGPFAFTSGIIHGVCSGYCFSQLKDVDRYWYKKW